jgi:hypothetical protein
MALEGASSEHAAGKLATTAPAPGCQVQAKNLCAPVTSAQLTAASGAVLLSRGTGFAEIKAGAALVAGDRLLVKQGSAKLSLGGTCQTTLGPQSMVTLVQKDGVLCAARLSSDPSSVAQANGNDKDKNNGNGNGAGSAAGTYTTAGMLGLAAVTGFGIASSNRGKPNCGNSGNTPAAQNSNGRCPISP